jgi:hypothetical protein
MKLIVTNTNNKLMLYLSIDYPSYSPETATEYPVKDNMEST